MSDDPRKPLSKRIRFEVFKRDSFKCQYCGSSAPEVVLHVDHIKPVASGGDDDLLNLVTACQACNGGKSCVELDDASTVQKSRRQAELLQERREQIAMMAEWHAGLVDLTEEATTAAVRHFEDMLRGYRVVDGCRPAITKLIRAFGLSEVLTAMTASGEHYLELGPDGNHTQESVDTAYRKIGGICAVNQRSNEDPFLKDTYYVRAMVRNQLEDRYYRHWEAFRVIHEALEDGIPFSTLKAAASNIRSWSDFRNRVRDLLEGK